MWMVYPGLVYGIRAFLLPFGTLHDVRHFLTYWYYRISSMESINDPKKEEENGTDDT